MPDRPSPSRPAIDLGPVLLTDLREGEARQLGAALAAIDPWRRMAYPADALTAYLERQDAAAPRYAVRCDDDLAGCLAVRDPWLKGPYLEILGLLPGFQGHGIGARILGWFEHEAGRGARNLWVVASSFNERAIAFYASHGFAPVATLPGLVCDNFDEVLLRKHPLGR